jgi:hypothetical protein
MNYCLSSFCRPLAAVLLGLLAAGAAQAQAQAQAQTSFYSWASAYGGHSVDRGDPFEAYAYQEREGVAPPGRLQAFADSDPSSVPMSGTASAWSQVDIAGVHLYAQSFSSAVHAPASRASGDAQAKGFFSDYFALGVPSYAAGTVFTVTAQVRSDGYTAAWTDPSPSVLPPSDNRGDAVTSWQSWIRVIGANQQNLAEVRAGQSCVERTYPGTPGFCVDDGQIGLATVSFQLTNFGAPVQLDIRGWASATTSAVIDGFGMISGHGVTDLSNTVAWAGITALHDGSGALIRDYTALSSSSGFDYRNAYASAVPEPGTSVLLLAGGLGVFWVARRRR